MTAGENAALEELLEFLKEDHGFDFTGYKRGTLVRRINRRMQDVHIADFRQYIVYLQTHTEEYNLLFDTILINVTEFFRDPEAWRYIVDQIIPKILSSKHDGDAIRVWSAGCSSGEEPYTIAMILCEAMGESAFKERVKIYATDVDEDALQRARHATYSAQAVEAIPSEIVDRYFEPVNGSFCFRNDLRRMVIFGRNDLVQDAPISRIDLLVCRNTFMYFNAVTQARILARLHFALNENGFLFLGKAEMLVSHSRLFVPVDPRWRVFTKTHSLSVRERFDVMAEARTFRSNPQISEANRLRVDAFEHGPNAEIVIENNGTIVLVNSRARTEFDLEPDVVGTPIKDLQLSYRPVEIRSVIDDVLSQHQTIETGPVRWPTENGTDRFFKLIAQPLGNGGTSNAGVNLSFVDVTESVELQTNLEHANQELETAYEELQSANEELETTNEELNSTVEELETTNEELQSTNEELETMNEELQSTNEELETINVELQVRTAELNAANVMMESILSRSLIGVIVVDREIRVMVWNRRSEDLWGLRATEVQNQFLLNLDMGLPVEDLLQPIRTCLADSDARVRLEITAMNRRGRTVRCAITCDPLVRDGKNVDGVILWIDELAVVSDSDRLDTVPEEPTS
ncbi:MAG: CheR family methyltransferase [Nitrolancea sp.]